MYQMCIEDVIFLDQFTSVFACMPIKVYYFLPESEELCKIGFSTMEEYNEWMTNHSSDVELS